MDNFLTEMLTRAVGSDFFAGGLALGAFGAAIGILRMVYGMARAQARRRWAVSLTVDNRSEAYRHLYVWLDRKGVLRRRRQVSARAGPRYLPLRKGATGSCMAGGCVRSSGPCVKRPVSVAMAARWRS